MVGICWAKQLFLLPLDAPLTAITVFVRVLEALSRLSLVVLETPPIPLCMESAAELAASARCRLKVDPLWQGEEAGQSEAELQSFLQLHRAQYVPREPGASRIEQAINCTGEATRMVIVTRTTFQQALLIATGNTGPSPMLFAHIDTEKSSLVFAASSLSEVEIFEPARFILDETPLVTSTLELKSSASFTPALSLVESRIFSSGDELLVPQKKSSAEIELTEKLNHELASVLCQPLAEFRQALVATEAVHMLSQAEEKLAALQDRFAGVWQLLQTKVENVKDLKETQSQVVTRLLSLFQDITQTQDRIHHTLQATTHTLTSTSEELKQEIEARAAMGKQLATTLAALQARRMRKPYAMVIQGIGQMEDGTVGMTVFSNKHYTMWVMLDISGEGTSKRDYKSVQCAGQTMNIGRLEEFASGNYSVTILNKEGTKAMSTPAQFYFQAFMPPAPVDFSTSFLYNSIANIDEVERSFPDQDSLAILRKVAVCWVDQNPDLVEEVLETVMRTYEQGEAAVFEALRAAGCNLNSS